MGDRDAARQELALSIAAAKAREEQYELALALDALGALGPLDHTQRAERDAIVARLGVVQLPAILQPNPDRPVEAAASKLASV
jgi:hypothetical protein